MAGQPQDPSWQPAGQDQDQAQARAAWPQQPTFTPPAGTPQEAYGYPPPTGQRGYAAPPTAAAGYASQPPPPPGYAGPERTYAAQDQAYQSQTPAHGQPDPSQWQAVPGMQLGRPGVSKQRARGERGFFGSLLDFSFTSMVTPKIIKVLYVLATIWTALLALIILRIAFKTGGTSAGLIVLFVVEPIFVLLMLGVYRVILEAFMVVFRIYEETVKIREQGDRQL
jgi:Domain of unknown function (DUF4282)